MMASEEAKGSFCRDDSCVVTNQLATDPGALERELLVLNSLDRRIVDECRRLPH